LVASKILTGKSPHVLEAIQFRPGRPAGDLRSTSLLGEVHVDPRQEDLFVKVVEERKRAQAAGHESRAAGLKVVVNATSYGIYAQMTRHEMSAKRKAKVVVYSDADEPWEWSDRAIEEPGDFSFPPLAASITGGARLMLALLERQVTDHGGSYAFCDTDSWRSCRRNAVEQSRASERTPSAGIKSTRFVSDSSRSSRIRQKLSRGFYSNSRRRTSNHLVDDSCGATR